MSQQNTAPATKAALQGPQSPAPATTSENEPHVEKSRFIALVTKTERLEDHHHVQSAAPATKPTRVQIKPLRSLAPVTKSRLWTTEARFFPSVCHEK